MPKLTYNKIERIETDVFIIENLQRKGWELIIDPVIPEYNPFLERLIFDERSAEYSVEELSENEIKERYIQESLVKLQINILSKIAAGYNVSPENFMLSLRDEDRVLFTQMISLVREALDLGLITNDTPQTITDINNQEITLSTLRFRQIMVGYGMYYKSLWDQME